VAAMAIHAAGIECSIDLGRAPGVGMVPYRKKTAGKRETQQ